MPRTRPIGITFDRFLERLSKLILRDPLTREFLDFPVFDKYYADPLDKGVSKQYDRYRDRLRAKWGVDVKPVPPLLDRLPASLRANIPQCLHIKPSGEWNGAEQELYYQKAFVAGARPHGVQVSGFFWPLRWTVNDGCVSRPLLKKLLPLDIPIERRPPGFYGSGTLECSELAEGRLAEGWNGYHNKSCFGWTRLPMDLAHKLTLEVNLARITTRNLDDLAREFKRIVRYVLPAAPKPSQKLEAALAFLWNASQWRFDRALKAYDLHMTEGQTFVDIGKQVRVSADQVETDVKLLHQAIHRTLHIARRRRLDTPAHGVPAYHCPQHGQNCPRSCQHMKGWLKKINRMLPTDNSGLGQVVNSYR